MEVLRPWLLLGSAALAGGIIGYLLLSNGRAKAYGAFAAAHVFGVIGLVAAMQSRTEMDAMVYWMFLVIFVLPSMVGVGLSGAIHYWRNR